MACFIEYVLPFGLLIIGAAIVLYYAAVYDKECRNKKKKGF